MNKSSYCNNLGGRIRAVGSKQGFVIMGRMHYQPRARYALAFDGEDASVEIDAFDSAEAFARAQKLLEREAGPATLYENGTPLARIGYSRAGFWTVSPSPSVA